MSDTPKAEVLEKAKVTPLIYEHSFETHVGDESVIDSAFVKRCLEILFYYPFKTGEKIDTSKDTLTKMYENLQKLATAFTSKDGLVKVGFSGVQEFLLCFDMACLD